jgi:hypothetical protein
MKKNSNPVSPFLILLIPALLAVGFKSFKDDRLQAENQRACVNFQVPSLKGVIKILF